VEDINDIEQNPKRNKWSS